MKSEKWYTRRLAKHFEANFSEYEDTIEYFVDPAMNIWKFYIPEKNVIVELHCDDEGEITEYRIPGPSA